MSSRHRAAPRFGAVGPVEPEDPSGTPAAPEPTGRTLLPSLRGLWSRAPRRTRLALAALLPLLAGSALVALPRPRHTPPAPPPWPAQATSVVYRGAGAAADPARRIFSARIAISVSAATPVTVTAVTQEYAGLALVTTPPPPFEVRSGQPVEAELRIRVTDCRSAPVGLSLPFVNVTLRNTRAIQTQSEILGAQYAHDLSAALRLLCQPSAVRTRGLP